MAGQAAQFAIVDHWQRHFVIALLNGFDCIAHIDDGFGQVGRQTAGQQVRKAQCKERQNQCLEQDFLLALVEGLIGHADHYPAGIAFCLQCCLAVTRRQVITGAVSRHANRCLEYLGM